MVDSQAGLSGSTQSRAKSFAAGLGALAVAAMALFGVAFGNDASVSAGAGKAPSMSTGVTSTVVDSTTLANPMAVPTLTASYSGQFEP
jgi:hypothetical protein